MKAFAIALVVWIIALLASPASAQSDKSRVNIMYGFVPDPERMTMLSGEEMKRIFADQTVRGIYDVFRHRDQRYVELMTGEGRAEYHEGTMRWDGVWYIRRNDMCFRYTHQPGFEHCFRLYAYGDCYLSYSNDFVLGYVPLDISRWNAVKQIVEPGYEWPDVPHSEAEPFTCDLGMS